MKALTDFWKNRSTTSFYASPRSWLGKQERPKSVPAPRFGLPSRLVKRGTMVGDAARH